jgi:hypothetical protein
MALVEERKEARRRRPVRFPAQLPPFLPDVIGVITRRPARSSASCIGSATGFRAM